MSWTKLEEVAQWLDALYNRISAAEFAIAFSDGKEALSEEFQDCIERAVTMGIGAEKPMEHCSLLFEALNTGEMPPRDILLRARSEVNNLAIYVRILSNDEFQATKKKSRVQPDHQVTKWVRVHRHKYANNVEAVDAYVSMHGGNAKKLLTDLRNDLRKKPLAKPAKKP